MKNIIVAGIDSIDIIADTYFKGLVLTELRTAPASLLFISNIRDINKLKLIIEKGFDSEKKARDTVI